MNPLTRDELLEHATTFRFGKYEARMIVVRDKWTVFGDLGYALLPLRGDPKASTFYVTRDEAIRIARELAARDAGREPR